MCFVVVSTAFKFLWHYLVCIVALLAKEFFLMSASLSGFDISFVRCLKKIYGHTAASLAAVECSYYSMLAHLLGTGSGSIIFILIQSHY